MSTVGMRALGLTPAGPEVTDQAVAAAAEWLHGQECDDDCTRWSSANHERHREYYRDLARGALHAAAEHMGVASG